MKRAGDVDGSGPSASLEREDGTERAQGMAGNASAWNGRRAGDVAQ